MDEIEIGVAIQASERAFEVELRETLNRHRQGSYVMVFGDQIVLRISQFDEVWMMATEMGKGIVAEVTRNGSPGNGFCKRIEFEQQNVKYSLGSWSR
jgi:hypothetical protein